MKPLLYTLLLALASTLAIGQAQPLPHQMSADEARQMASYLQDLLAGPKSIPVPPPTAVRTMAEWEEIQALVITWSGFPSILTEIVRAAVPECKVYIVTQSAGTVASQLTAAGVPLTNVEFINAPFNSVWIRDYGPWAVYQNDVDSLNITDWIYNRPRPLDDAVPIAVSNTLGLPIYEATQSPYNMVHTGGNHLHDGISTAYSSDLFFEENPGRTEAELNRVVDEFLGVKRHIKLRRLPYDVIHHVDMHIRNVDEETMFIARYPDGVADGPQIDANVDYLRSNFRTAFGNTYNIIRMDSPPGANGAYPNQGGPYRTYTNALFLNKTIIVPIYQEQYDTVALRQYREELPGYNVVGIDCNGMINSLGALHCITKTIGVNEPLWIAHPRLRDTYVTDAPYAARAIIKHRSGIASATLHYRTAQGQPYSAQPMTLADADTDTWTAEIPAQAAGTELQYYIHAEANNGKQQVRPLVAPEGYYRFAVRGYAAAPVAGFLQNISSTCAGGTIRFTGDASGGVGEWLWSFPGGSPATSTEANPLVTYAAPGLYDVSLTVSNPMGSHTLARPGAVRVQAAVPPFSDDFTSGPHAAWEIDNFENDATTWALAQTPCGGECFRLANVAPDNRFTRDYFRASVDLSSLNQPMLSFDVAYARRTNRYDELRVNILRCDGEKLTVFAKSGSSLATAAATNTAFVPSTCSQWRTEQIDLADFAGETVWIEFEGIGGWGNNLYIDNINLSGAPNLAPAVSISSPADGTFLQVAEPPTLHITATASDADGTVAQVAFFVDGQSIGTLTEAPYTLPYTFPTTGTYLLTAAATDDAGATTLSAPVSITIDLAVSTTAIQPLLGLVVFPNPAESVVYVRWVSRRADAVRYALVDALGRTVRQGQWAWSGGMQEQALPVAGLPAGHYALRLHGEHWQQVRKVVVR